MNSEIDFVITWVDGNDKKWLEDKRQYSKEDNIVEDVTVDNDEARYREWDFLKYWFRSIEENAPWVRKIHFITYGHLPKFLNVSHPKINIVNHKDYIPEKYLPTFSSHPIELNMHRIEDLSECFVYFNDDVFLNQKVKKEDFFKNGKPCHQALESLIQTNDINDIYWHILLNNMAVVNKNFDKREVYKKNLGKWINLKYGKEMLRNICLLPWSKFQCIKNAHIAVPLLKSTIQEVWNKEYEVMDKTSMSRFRAITDINQYLFRYWDILQGNFEPSCSLGNAYHVNNGNVEDAIKDIKDGKSKVICINDGQGMDSAQFINIKQRINESFETRYPDKSNFEI